MRFLLPRRAFLPSPCYYEDQSSEEFTLYKTALQWTCEYFLTPIARRASDLRNFIAEFAIFEPEYPKFPI